MDIFSKTYLKILEEATLTSFSELNPKDFAKSNGNFPEGKDLDITDEFDIPDLISIKISSHCINSNNDHGFNFVELKKEQEMTCIKQSIFKLLKTYSIKELFEIKKRRFFLKCINKKTNETYKLALETTIESKKVQIRLITFLKSRKFFEGTVSKKEYIKQFDLGE